MKLGRHVVYEKYEDIPDDVAADFVATDPPWNETNIGFDKKGFDNNVLAAWLKDHMKLNAWCMAFLPFEVAMIFAKHMRNKFIYVWKKQPGMYRPSTMRPVMAHELIYAFIQPDLKRMTDLYMDKKKLRTNGKPYKDRSHCLMNSEYTAAMGFDVVMKPTSNTGFREGTSILEFSKLNGNTKERTGHPTQKPLRLMRLLIRAYCPPGGTIIDPTLGSGTTLMAAELEGRTCIGAEINPEYQKMIRNRFNKTLGGWQE